MAGTLTIGTLSDGTNSTSATNAIQGSAKAWVNFNGVTTATVRASYNVSSVTRNATGDYTINFSTAMPDANYSVVGTTTGAGDNKPGGVQLASSAAQGAASGMTTSACNIRTGYGNSATAFDFGTICVSIFR